VSLKWLLYQQQQQQEEQQQDAENPFLDPPFSRIKTDIDISPISTMSGQFHACSLRREHPLVTHHQRFSVVESTAFFQFGDRIVLLNLLVRAINIKITDHAND
jgi:hypothetical protein